ncbi:MAG: DUF4012 domain-containing protein [Candidatus Uhrbacteria bacterium]|nr:DUF4012 domain-containing protein [Candidatus Uhrbacteria bacterium]
MAKKVLNQFQKQPEPRKNLSRVSFERALRNAVRRQSLLDDGLRFDEAIPENFRTSSTISAENPSVQLQESSTLSPFILELRPHVPSPESLLRDEPNMDIHLNFLADALAEMERDEEPLTDTTHDLELSLADLQGQMSAHTPAPKTTFEGMLFHPRIMFRTRMNPELMPLRIQKQESVSIDSFEPKMLPENILSYFDLPEEEVVEESSGQEVEYVDLESLFDVEDVPDLTSDEPEEKPKRSWIPSFDFLILPSGWQQTIGVFVLLSFVFVLPLHAMQVLNRLRDAKTDAQANGAQALQSLKDAAGANLVSNPTEAGAHFAAASVEFGKAKENIDSLGSGVSLLLAALAPTQKSVKTNTALLKIGSELSIAGSRITDGFSAMQQEVNPTPSSRLEILHLYLSSALPHLVAAEDAMKDVDLTAINDDHKETYTQLTTTLPALVSSTKDFLSLSDALSTILGANETKHYLLIFQNNTELRPTGGFMGSFAEMTVHNGVMEQLDIPGGGTYDLQGQQKQSFVAPWPLQLLSAKWEFQDANWFPDFRTSARHIISFYKNSRGSDVDGVIAVNANYVQDLIGLLGPVEMPEFDRTINQQNFISETQKIVENEYDKTENKPKAFIGALAPKLIEKALHESPDTFLTLAGQLNKGLADKDIQLYFTDETVEKTVLGRGWGGDLKQTDKDYLMIVNTNLGGGKTDAVIDEHVDVNVDVASNGEITNTVTITRKHHGDPLDPFTGAHNVNYQRLYVPKGSVLTHAEGFTIPRGSLFETPDPTWIVDPDLQFADASFTIDKDSGTQMYEENGKTVFGNWTQTKPGTETVTTFTYTLPFTLNTLVAKNKTTEEIKSWLGLSPTENYSILLQKQSGANNRSTTVHVHTPNSMKTVWSSQDLSHAEFPNSEDAFLSALFEPSL